MLTKWIIVGVLILIGFWYLKFEHHAHKIKAVVILLIVGLIYFSMMGMFSSEQIDITSPRGVVSAVYVYFGWIGQTAGNLWNIGVDTTHMVGNAIKLDDDKDNKDRR